MTELLDMAEATEREMVRRAVALFVRLGLLRYDFLRLRFVPFWRVPTLGRAQLGPGGPLLVCTEFGSFTIDASLRPLQPFTGPYEEIRFDNAPVIRADLLLQMVTLDSDMYPVIY